MNIVIALTVVVGLTMVPLALDLLRSFAAFRRAHSQLCSASLICAVSTICLIAVTLFFLHVLPFHCPRRGSAGWLGLSLLAVCMCTGTIASHIASVLIQPGTAGGPAAATAAGCAPAEGSTAATSASRVALPPHARFCSVCRCAVLDADHHCIFTGTCIGRYNRSAFYLFLAHLLAGATFAVLVSAQPFRQCVLRRLLGLAGMPRDPLCRSIGPGQIALVPALMVWLPIAPLVAWHALLLRADLSTAHFVKKASSAGLGAAVRELLGTRRKPLRDNRAWQLARGHYARADAIARGAAESPQPANDSVWSASDSNLKPKAG
jgi:hypothetical protein